MASNIARIREERGISQVALAERLGMHVTNLNKLERGKTSPSQARLTQIARELDVRVADLIESRDPSTVPLMGYVGAGAEVEPDFEQVPADGFEAISVPFPMPDEMIAFKVTGVSMMPQFRDGAIIIVYREQKRATESFFGEEAVVRTHDGRRFIKTILRGSRGITLNSWNAEPIENVDLVWIGEIFAILPPSSIRKVARQGGLQGQLPLRR